MLKFYLITQKAAIKKMDMKASKEFFAELKVLTRVHHLNLVIAYEKNLIWFYLLL